MRLFYVPTVKKYIFLPALAVFSVTFVLQLVPSLFMNELSVLAAVKTKLGYTTTFFPSNTFLTLRILFSIFYAFIGAVSGLVYFRIKYRKRGNTILLSETAKGLSGIVYLLLLYGLFNSEVLSIPNITPPRIQTPQLFPQLSNKLLSFFIPRIQIAPQGSTPSSASYTYNPPASSTNSNSNNPPAQSGSVQTLPQKPPPTNVPPRMTTAQELFSQLNSYRQRNGRSPLVWDATLTNYSQQRVNLYASLGNTDQHAGFNTDTRNGLNYKFGFYGLGENSSFGATGSALYLIEDWFGKSAPHNTSQLDTRWTHVGIGVSGSAINFIFGGGKTDSFHVK